MRETFRTRRYENEKKTRPGRGGMEWNENGCPSVAMPRSILMNISLFGGRRIRRNGRAYTIAGEWRRREWKGARSRLGNARMLAVQNASNNRRAEQNARRRRDRVQIWSTAAVEVVAALVPEITRPTEVNPSRPCHSPHNRRRAFKRVRVHTRTHPSRAVTARLRTQRLKLAFTAPTDKHRTLFRSEWTRSVIY